MMRIQRIRNPICDLLVSYFGSLLVCAPLFHEHPDICNEVICGKHFIDVTCGSKLLWAIILLSIRSYGLHILLMFSRFVDVALSTLWCHPQRFSEKFCEFIPTSCSLVECKAGVSERMVLQKTKGKTSFCNFLVSPLYLQRVGQRIVGHG